MDDHRSHRTPTAGPAQSRSRSSLGSDDRANSLLIGFVVAAGVFLITMGAVIQITNDSSDQATDPGPDLDAQARQVLDLILTRPGATTSGNPAWHEDAENLERFGLALVDRPVVLDYDKVQNLRDSNITASHDNGVADYPEVLEALDINNSYDLHLRTYPVFLSVDDSNWVQDKGIEPAYLGHGESGVNGSGTATYAWANGTDHVTLEATITNTHSTDTAIFKVSFILDEADGDNLVVDDQFTKRLWPGENDTIRFRLYEGGSWDTDHNLTARLIGPYGSELQEDVFDPVDLTALDGGEPDHTLMADPASNHFVGGDNLTLYLDHRLSDGSREKSKDVPDAVLSVEDPSGTEVENTTVTLPHNEPYEWTCPAGNCSATGNYTVTLMTPSHDRKAVDQAYVSDSELFAQTKTLTGDAQYEAGLLEDLLAGFDNSTNTDANPEGDVYVDSQSSVERMVENLDSYDLLVVGSNVEHSVMTDANTKYAIRDWVHDGGHLVVLGTSQQNTQWLQPLYGSGTSTANGGISTPDPTHPILQTPESLSYSLYEDHGIAWKLKDEEYYTHVIAKDGDGQQTEDTLAVSKPGVFGNGSVVLTSYIPSELTSVGDDDEPLKFLHNLAVHSYNMVFMDFGPTIPEGADVGSASRVAVVPHPSLPSAQVEVRVVVYMWR